MTDKQIATYCDDVKLTALKQFRKIQDQRKEISILHKKCIRQQAEIERLNADIITMENFIKNTFLEKAGCDIDPLAEIKADAIKEFAERLKANVDGTESIYVPWLCGHIDYLVKEWRVILNERDFV